MIRKLSVVAAVIGVTIVLAAGPAFAHVEIERDGAVGPDGTVAATMTVPNEKTDSGTVKIVLVFPDAPEITAVEAGAVPGWTAVVEKSPTGLVQRITWTGGPLTGDKKLQLPFTLGPAPADVATMEFKATQTYDDSSAPVAWVEETLPGEAEPEHPAPVLYVQGSPPPEEPATKPAAGKHSSDGGTSTGAIVAIVIGVLIVLGLLGLLVRRGRSTRRSNE